MTHEVDARLDLLRDIHDAIGSDDHLQYLNIDVPSITREEIRFDRTERLSAWLNLDIAAKSIDDIKAHQHGLVFVGFLGHFTSGKSTLINAILSEPKQRTTDPNPTDKNISLICQPHDHDELRANAFTSIDDIHIETAPQRDFLNGVVLVDTPGLGNAKAEHELAERFLPLCHVVIITIDGQVPLADTEADFQLLDNAVNKLSEVPKIFAITKSFGFLSDRKGDFDIDWDETKAQSFWSGVIDRMLSDPRFEHRHDVINSIPVVFIDSIDGYNIDALMNKVLSLTADPDERSRVYKAQADYLAHIVRASIEVFREYLSQRLSHLDELHQEAARKATEAKDMLNRRTDSVNAAIVKALEQIDSITDAVQRLQEQTEFPAPSADLLGESFDGFSTVLRKMESHVSEWNSHCCEAVSENVRRQGSSIFRSLSFRNKQFDPSKLTVICDRPAQPVKPSDVAKWIRRMNDYADASCRWVARKIPKRWTVEYSNASANRIRTVFKQAFQTLTGGLGIFMNDYNVTARAFVAYLTQPDSRKLLRECGVILFDEDDERVLQAAEITNAHFSSRAAIDELVRGVETQLDEIENQERDALDELDQELYSQQLVSPQITADQVVNIVYDDQYAMKRKSEIQQFGNRLNSSIHNSLDKIGDLRHTRNSRLREAGFQWLATALKAGVVGLAAYLSLRLIESANIMMYERIWKWITSDAGPFVISVLAGVTIETIKFILGRDSDNNSRDKYSLGIRPTLNYFEAKGAVTRAFGETLRKETLNLSNLLGNIPVDMTQRVHALFKKRFEEMEENESVVKIGRMLKDFQNQRIAIYNDGRSTFHSHIATLRQELSSNPTEKSTETVDRVLDRISETRESVDQFSADLSDYDNQLAD